MSNHFSMGAINKVTNNYEYPKIATGQNKYKCPFCEKDVIFRNGKIKRPHFAHYKSDNPCSYYEKPNETQIHKDAKLLMKTLLDNKHCINIYRTCHYCDYESDSDDSFIHCLASKEINKEIEYFLNIKTDEYDDTRACIEYKFNHNNSKKSADVVLLKNNELKYIFEICYKNKTKEENRPEPWFEIKAEQFIHDTNSGDNVTEEGDIEIECIRDYKCVWCKDKEERDRERYIKEQEEYEIKRHAEFIEKLQIKEREGRLQWMKNVLLKKETREIEIKIKRQNALKERQIQMEKEKKELEERQRQINEYNMKMLELNKVCSGCNINYCKCSTPNFVKNEYNVIKCNTCDKRKCKCVRITDFFK